MKNLNEMKTKELKVIAKELGVKNWWTIKKVELIEGIQEKQNKKEETKLDMVDLLPDKNNSEPQKEEEKIESEVTIDKTELDEDSELDEILNESDEQIQKEISETPESNELNKSDDNKSDEPKESNEQPKSESTQETNDSDKNIVTLSMILDDLLKEGHDIKGTKARRILRKSTIQRPYKTWKWDKTKHIDMINAVKALLIK